METLSSVITLSDNRFYLFLFSSYFFVFVHNSIIFIYCTYNFIWQISSDFNTQLDLSRFFWLIPLLICLCFQFFLVFNRESDWINCLRDVVRFPQRSTAFFRCYFLLFLSFWVCFWWISTFRRTLPVCCVIWVVFHWIFVCFTKELGTKNSLFLKSVNLLGVKFDDKRYIFLFVFKPKSERKNEQFLFVKTNELHASNYWVL